MSEVNFESVRIVFEGAVDLPTTEREDYLARECGNDIGLRREVESLLYAHQEANTFLEEPPAGAADMQGAVREATSSRRIGPYRIVRQLGSGGFGSVYLGERDDDTFRKHVAIKVVGPWVQGEEMIRRFKHERRILAKLDHPNIARILDGGSTEDGLPYLVMEYVDGKPIDQHCHDNKLGLTQRLILMQQVSDAVHYLHEHGIVHRDLKPSNIMVASDGTVKILDFGIAKMAAGAADAGQSLDLTVGGSRLMTPSYASPEQMKGDFITPQSDIFSLGVIFYEIVTGEKPYRIGQIDISAILTMIETTQPERPSVVAQRSQSAGPETAAQLKRKLAGDLDNIILMAMRPLPTHRYASARALSDDIGRFLDGLPVIARKPTVGYHTSKFVGRNKLAIVITLMMIILAGTAGWYYYRTQIAVRDTQEQELALAGILAKLHENMDRYEADAAAITETGDEGPPAPYDAPLAGDLTQFHDISQKVSELTNKKPGASETRAKLVDDAKRYLDRAEKLPKKSTETELKIVSGYQGVAAAQGPPSGGGFENPEGAANTLYQAALVLARLTEKHPENPEVQQLSATVQNNLQAYALAGIAVPEIPATQIPVVEVEPPAPIVVPPPTRVPPVSTKTPAPPPMPTPTPTPTPQPPPVVTQVPVPRELTDLRIRASSRVNAAREGFEPIRQTLQQQNMTPRSDIQQALEKMQIFLETGQAQMLAGQYKEAQQSLKSSEFYANEVLKFIGR